MLKLNLMPLLERDNRTRYSLYKELGLSYTNFRKMVDGETKSIRFTTLEALCVAFKCTPNDLFIFDSSKPEGNQPPDNIGELKC